MTNYPQWHKSHCRKKPGEHWKNESGKPTQKRHKTKVEEDMDAKSQSEYKTNTEDGPNMDVDEDNTNEGISLSVGHDNLKGSGSSSLRPRAWPLTQGDPL